MAISSGSSVSQTRLSGEMAVGGRGEGQRGDMGKEFGRITEPFSRICKKGRNARERRGYLQMPSWFASSIPFRIFAKR